MRTGSAPKAWAPDAQTALMRRLDDDAHQLDVEHRSLARLERDLDDRRACVSPSLDGVPGFVGARELRAVAVRAPRPRRITTGNGQQRPGETETQRRMR